jgi:hypothetical protein
MALAMRVGTAIGRNHPARIEPQFHALVENTSDRNAGSECKAISLHICSSKATPHKVYHDGRRPLHFLLPDNSFRLTPTS